MVADLKQNGMVDCVRDSFKIVEKTCESLSAQVLSTFPGTPSGPESFLGLSIDSTSCGLEMDAGRGWEGLVIDCWVGISCEGVQLLS